MSDTGLQAMISAAEDHLIDAIDFAAVGRPTASYVTERKSVRIPFLAPIYSPNGVTVMRATIADPGWLDTSCCHLSCLVENISEVANSQLLPLTTSIGGAFQRGRLISGQVLEDVLEYGRVCHIYDIMKPKAAQTFDQTMGFPKADGSEGSVHGAPIAPNKSKRVWHKPCFGLLNQDKWIPTNYAPLTFEFTLGDANQWLHTGSYTLPGGSAVANSTSWRITEAYLYYDLCTLDSEVQANYANVLRSGQALNISYHSSLMQSQTVLGASFTIQIMRNLTRVKSMLVTLSRKTSPEDAATKVETTQLFHPALPAGEYADSQIEAFIQIGGKKMPVTPIGPRDAAQLWFALQKAAGVVGTSVMPIGISYDEFLNIAASGKRSFVYATDLEKVAHAGYSGEDFGGGRALLIDMKNVGTEGDTSTQATRCHVLLVHEAAMSITESGVMVTS